MTSIGNLWTAFSNTDWKAAFQSARAAREALTDGTATTKGAEAPAPVTTELSAPETVTPVAAVSEAVTTATQTAGTAMAEVTTATQTAAAAVTEVTSQAAKVVSSLTAPAPAPDAPAAQSAAAPRDRADEGVDAVDYARRAAIAAQAKAAAVSLLADIEDDDFGAIALKPGNSGNGYGATDRAGPFSDAAPDLRV